MCTGHHLPALAGVFLEILLGIGKVGGSERALHIMQALIDAQIQTLAQHVAAAEPVKAAKTAASGNARAALDQATSSKMGQQKMGIVSASCPDK